MTKLEKMDAMKERFGMTYEQAKEALEAAGWNLAKATQSAEENRVGAPGNSKKSTMEEIESFVRDIIDQIKEIIQEGNVTRVRLKDKDRTLIEVPATIGVIGLGVMLFSPLMLVFTAVGAIAAISKELTFEVEKSDGTIEKRDLKWGSGQNT